MKVRFAARARRHLAGIHTYIAQHNPQAANAVLRRIRAAALSLEQFPHLGHVGKLPGTYERSVPGLPYVIVYGVITNPEEVLILGIFHGAQERH